LALASPANCCFQASNPPGPLPHCAALALLAIHANAIRVMEVAAASRLHLIIENSLLFDRRRQALVSPACTRLAHGPV
jgi:hypothetical protein